jgi:CheY-like chemotaxis protein
MQPMSRYCGSVEANMSNAFDVIFIDDEVSLTEIFQYYVLARYKHWRFLAMSNASMAYREIVFSGLSARVWIVDMMMPGKNGAQIASAIRARHGHNPMVLAYTALDRIELQRQEEYCNDLHHFNKIINKMEDPTSLLSLVDIWVPHAELTR